MKGRLPTSVFLFFLGSSLAGFSVAQNVDSSNLIQHIVSSNITNQDYRLFVVMPEKYNASSEETYDVVYVLDINSEDSAQLVQFQRTFTKLPNIPEFILVGIGFSPDEEHRGLRTAHFSPSRDEEIDTEILALYPMLSMSENARNWQTGKAREFANVLSTEIIPYVEANFVASDTNTVMGASLAGLFLAVVLFEQPDMFENYVITSPSVWWNGFELFENTDLLNRKDLQGKVYLSVGGLENSEMLESYNRLSNALRENDSAELIFTNEVIDNQTHLSVIPISYMNGLNYIFSGSSD
jgi:uncharacterized protein